MCSKRRMPKCDQFCPLCYANVRGRSSYRGHRGYRAPRVVRLESVTEMLRKHTKTLVRNGPMDMASLGTQLQLYPALTEFLFRSVWEEDGEPREPGTALIFGDGVHLKVMLNDKAQALVAFSTLTCEEDILGEIDAMVLSTSTDWRPARRFTKGK